MNRKIILKSWGGIGDALVCTPAINSLKKLLPNQKIVLYCRSKAHLDVFINNPNIDSLWLINRKYFWLYPVYLFDFIFNGKKVTYISLSFQVIPPSFIYKKSIKKIVADIFKVGLADNRNQLFLTHNEDIEGQKLLAPFGKVILLHIYSKSSVNHHWEIEKWATLVKQFPGYNFIQIGMKNEESVPGTIDFRGKTTLRQAFGMIKFSSSFVGIDSSFAHVTNAFNIPGVVLFGDSDPVIWGHENNINIYKKTECSPCFYYLRNEKCPYDHPCMRLITVDEVKNALTSQLQIAHDLAHPSEK